MDWNQVITRNHALLLTVVAELFAMLRMVDKSAGPSPLPLCGVRRTGETRGSPRSEADRQMRRTNPHPGKVIPLRPAANPLISFNRHVAWHHFIPSHQTPPHNLPVIHPKPGTLRIVDWKQVITLNQTRLLAIVAELFAMLRMVDGVAPSPLPLAGSEGRARPVARPGPGLRAAKR